MGDPIRGVLVVMRKKDAAGAPKEGRVLRLRERNRKRLEARAQPFKYKQGGVGIEITEITVASGEYISTTRIETIERETRDG